MASGDTATRFAPRGMVCAADHLAAGAGVAMLGMGGTAADAAVAAGAVLAVTAQHLCGMGGDLFALVHQPGGAAPVALCAAGRAGSGADPGRLRAEGHRAMPFRGDPRSVPVPGCVDGWLALHSRFGALPLAEVLAPARSYAVGGFPATPLLVAAVASVAHLPGADDYTRGAPLRPGTLVRRPGVARALEAVAAHGRAGFYEGEFGHGLLELGGGEYVPADLGRPSAEWGQPLSLVAWGRRVWTARPPSQGYLTLAGAWMAAAIGLPDDPDDALWAHLTVEAARQAAFDRLDVLHEGAEGGALLSAERLVPRAAAMRPDRAAALGVPAGAGDTTFIAAVDDRRLAVSLIQSNASGFGAHLVEPRTGIFLHNRGVGFRLEPGHPAEYRPGRRPPHTLCPTLVTDDAGHDLVAVLGTMGGDSQPQLLLQLLARLLASGQPPGPAVAAPRWALRPAREESTAPRGAGAPTSARGRGWGPAGEESTAPGGAGVPTSARRRGWGPAGEESTAPGGAGVPTSARRRGWGPAGEESTARTGFDTWERRGEAVIGLEADAPAGWEPGLAGRGHRVERARPGEHGFGHAQVIVAGDDHLAGAADPRAGAGAAVGW